MRLRRSLAMLVGLPLLMASWAVPPVSAGTHVQVILDGTPLPLDPAPQIVSDRTLVPVRGLFAAMGAEVQWDAATRSVTVTRRDRYVRLKIDRRLACLSPDCSAARVLDVPAQIIGDRTYVPVRFISQAMGVRVTWDAVRRAVIVETDKAPDSVADPVVVTAPAPGTVITEPVTLQGTGPGVNVQYLLLDPATGSGMAVAAGTDPNAAYTFTPDPVVTGARLLIAAVRDSAGVTRHSAPVPVSLAPQPRLTVTGISPGGVVEGPVVIGSGLSFVAASHVRYKLTDPATGAVTEMGSAGPGENFTWYPQVGHNGPKRIAASVTDRYGNIYESAPVDFTVQGGYRQGVSGVRDGQAFTRSLNLQVSTNYPVESIEWKLNGKQWGWGWNLSRNLVPSDSGSHKLLIEVLAKDGNIRTIGPINFAINAVPKVWVSGVGPNQVVTGAVTLTSSANVSVAETEYWLIDAVGRYLLLGRVPAGQSLVWTPGAAHAGSVSLQAIGHRADGSTVKSDPIAFRVFLGKIFPPLAIVAKDQFKDLAIRYSIPIARETGSSAALKVAQALLETGWGQATPVDKYTGQPSYNLFGIKGAGPAGSVISNTWEEYNGVSYRVDDKFRAYHNVGESFRDHSDLLLQRPWYAPYRAVMTDPVQGAWALRRSGYATDSQYPVKLINLMKQYDLFKLDDITL